MNLSRLAARVVELARLIFGGRHPVRGRLLAFDRPEMTYTKHWPWPK